MQASTPLAGARRAYRPQRKIHIDRPLPDHRAGSLAWRPAARQGRQDPLEHSPQRRSAAHSLCRPGIRPYRRMFSECKQDHSQDPPPRLHPTSTGCERSSSSNTDSFSATKHRRKLSKMPPTKNYQRSPAFQCSLCIVIVICLWAPRKITNPQKPYGCKKAA